MTTRPDKQKADMADARETELVIPCMHCKHLTSMGTQFDAEGWTCEAYPSQIPYTVLTLRTPHDEPLQSQPGELVAYDPIIYTEEDTGRQWHYTTDGQWAYVDDSKKSS